MSAVDKRLARWFYASIAKHLHDCLDSSFPIYVDFLECPTPTWHDADAKASASIEGPHVTENRLAKVAVVMKLVSNRGSNDYEHIDRAGCIQNCLDRCIVIMNHDDTEGTEEIAVIRTAEEIRVLHIEPAITDKQLHTIVTARYDGDI